eukprot:1012221_1
MMVSTAHKESETQNIIRDLGVLRLEIDRIRPDIDKVLPAFLRVDAALSSDSTIRAKFEDEGSEIGEFAQEWQSDSQQQTKTIPYLGGVNDAPPSPRAVGLSSIPSKQNVYIVSGAHFQGSEVRRLSQDSRTLISTSLIESISVDSSPSETLNAFRTLSKVLPYGQIWQKLVDMRSQQFSIPSHQTALETLSSFENAVATMPSTVESDIEMLSNLFTTEFKANRSKFEVYTSKIVSHTRNVLARLLDELSSSKEIGLGESSNKIIASRVQLPRFVALVAGILTSISGMAAYSNKLSSSTPDITSQTLLCSIFDSRTEIGESSLACRVGRALADYTR